MVGRYYHLDATGLLGETLDREVSLKELRLWLWPVVPIYCYHLLTFRRQPLKMGDTTLGRLYLEETSALR